VSTRCSCAIGPSTPDVRRHWQVVYWFIVLTFYRLRGAEISRTARVSATLMPFTLYFPGAGRRVDFCFGRLWLLSHLVNGVVARRPQRALVRITPIGLWSVCSRVWLSSLTVSLAIASYRIETALLNTVDRIVLVSFGLRPMSSGSWLGSPTWSDQIIAGI